MNKNTPLSPRLKSAASFVPHGCRMADIGTDHARLPIYLIKTGTVKSAIASDISDGPLEKAAENLKYYGLTDSVSLRKADGLLAVSDYEVDCAVIAGMGGELISHLLEKYIPEGLKKLIIQPMTDAFFVRRALSKRGFKIVAEDIVPERNKMYIIICAEPGKIKLAPNEDFFSPQLKLHPLYKDYLAYRLKLTEKSAVRAIKAGAETDTVKEYLLFKKEYEKML